MNRIIQPTLIGIGSVGMVAGLSISHTTGKRSAEKLKPNIVYILADDLGYGDLGCYGQTKIETPNIDGLAREGMLFTQHYSGCAVSAPARCTLLTGLHSGKAQIRSNDPMPERGNVQNYRAMLINPELEGNRPLAAGTYTIGTMLKSVGYTTGIIGKWGLGAPGTDGLPNRMGFDFFYGYVCQRQAHTYYPLHLWKNEQRVWLNNDTVAPHTPLREGDDPFDPESYAPYTLNDYSPDLMFREITGFVESNKDKPFFLYWATTIPHLPLQAPKRWVDYYVKKFGDEEPYPGRNGGEGYFPCRYPRATYAAMISYLDEQIGQLIVQLKRSGLYENTLIIFSSDNGPTGAVVPWFKSASPFRSEAGYIKGSLYEGGIREPMIAAWPGVIKPGSVSNHVSAFYDLMPTLAEITGADIPENISGISFFPELKGKKQPQHEYLYWEFPGSGGQMAVRMGNLKAIRKNMHKGNLKWELYNLENDPAERTDISQANQEIITRANNIVKKEHAISLYEGFRFKVLGE